MTTATETKTDVFLSEVDQFSAHNYHPLPVVLERGEGSWVWDVDGNRYLDMLSAYSALNQGHRHPAIIAAAVAQLHEGDLALAALVVDPPAQGDALSDVVSEPFDGGDGAHDERQVTRPRGSTLCVGLGKTAATPRGTSGARC